MDLTEYRGSRHFILVHGKFPTRKQTERLVVNQVFNHPDNLYGDYLQVAVASRIVGEGLSFKGARQFHSLTPGWNETELQQAEEESIEHLLMRDSKNPKNHEEISLVRYAYSRGFSSVDFYMYRLSEIRISRSAGIERLFKEAAVDCALNAQRNMRFNLDPDGSRASQL